MPKKKSEPTIALLRGINVSGQKLIKMTELKAMFEALHFNEISTYIQSGNIVFKAENTDCKSLETLIAKQIDLKFGFDVHVQVNTLNEWKQFQSACPFSNISLADQKYLHLTLLSETPADTLVQKLKELKFENEEFKLLDKGIYLFCPAGYGKTKLSNNFFESKLKVKATTRNWNTVNQLLEMAEKLSAS